MVRASKAIGDIRMELFTSHGDHLDKIREELSVGLGDSFSRTNVLALLGAHSVGLAHLCTAEGLGQAIFLYYAALYLRNLDEYANSQKAEAKARESALS